MGKINSRAKGAAGERELANYLREQGWQKARRTQQKKKDTLSPLALAMNDMMSHMMSGKQ